MPGMLDLADMLELFADAFDQRSFSQQEFIDDRQQFIFHVALELGNQLYAFAPEFIK